MPTGAVDFDVVYREWLPAQFRDRMGIFPTDDFDRWQNGTIAWQPKTAELNLANQPHEGHRELC